MKEYTIKNKATNERNIIYGYNQKDAMRRNPSVNLNEWKIVRWDYAD